MKPTKTTQIDRSLLLQVTGSAAAVCIIGCICQHSARMGGRPGAPAMWCAPINLITSHPDNTFTLIAKNPETGQGIRAALAMSSNADEFDIDWSHVRSSRRIGSEILSANVSAAAHPDKDDPRRQIERRRPADDGDSSLPRWSGRRLNCTTGSCVVTHVA